MKEFSLEHVECVTSVGESYKCPSTTESLDIELKKYFYNGDISTITMEEKENFIGNVRDNQNLARYIEQNPDYFGLLFSYVCMKKYNPQEIENLIGNVVIRHIERTKNITEERERKKENPIATEDEYRAGVYRESLETQVRDAVFELQRKGYKTTESGFDDSVRGTQYIGIKKDGVDVDTLKNSLPKEVALVESEDRFQIIFATKPGATIEELKRVWDSVVSNIPNNTRSIDGLIDNGFQGVEFRETQDSMKAGKNTWLGGGLAFIDGKVIEMSYQDFMKI